MADTPKFYTSKSVTVLGCPFSGGQRRLGVDTGPNKLVEAGLVNQLEELGWKVQFEGHQHFEDVNAEIAKDTDIGVMKNPRTVSEVCNRVAKLVSETAQKGSMPLTLGGDHSLVRRCKVYGMCTDRLRSGTRHCTRIAQGTSRCCSDLDRCPR